MESLWNKHCPAASPKSTLRLAFAGLRKCLSQERRRSCGEELCTSFSKILSSFALILSFSSLRDEIDTTLLNVFLSRNGRLALPKVEGDTLAYFYVTDPENQLTVGYKGIKEPIPSLCTKLKPEEIEAIIVPGLAFDKEHYRLGYGKGHYDRLLATLPFVPSFGIGFKEQFTEILPHSSHDVPLNHIYLF